jgi:hypothetical protein
MSATFYISDWDKQPSTEQKLYAHIEFESFNAEEIEMYFSTDLEYKKDENGYYRITTIYSEAFPELNLSNENTKSILESLGYQYDYSGKFPEDQISEVITAGLKLINDKVKLNNSVRTIVSEGNFITTGIDQKYISRTTLSLIELLMFAKKNNKYVYWV